jgi:alkane 1-monooxygenase
VVGASSGYSIITAHELIHRKGEWPQRLGRALLCTVLYEHFYTEHLRGHHVRVATPDDPATARFGETFQRFYRRTVPAQFKSAWRLEKRRLGDEAMSNLDPRMLRHRVLHGLAVELGLAGAIALAFGWVSLLAFVLQAFLASRLLEIVNYFEHWGLERKGARVGPTESWDTHSWFTYWSLIGLSRHADHHTYGSRPFQRLRVVPEAPILPHGYVGTIFMVMVRNREFRRLATAELQRLQLGPFREAGAGGATAA